MPEDTFPDRRVLLKDVAFDSIKDLIVRGRLRPGDFVSERELAAMLSMSKTPVRAALERLSMDGWVSVSPQRGIVVREMGLAEIHDHYDLRIALETFVVRRVAGRLSQDRLEALDADMAEQQERVARRDTVGYVAADGRFHMLLTESLGNAAIERIMRVQQDKLTRVGEQISRRDPDRMVRSSAEHAEILAAVRDGDGERAAHLMTEHLESGKQFLLGDR